MGIYNVKFANLQLKKKNNCNFLLFFIYLNLSQFFIYLNLSHLLNPIFEK